MKRTIVTSGGSDRHDNHRRDFETCPTCDQKIDHDRWMNTATTLILNPRDYKAGYVAVMSECPKCFEGSWVHVNMGGWEYLYEKWPKKWIDKVAKFEKEVKLEAVRACAFSLCGKCSKLHDMKVDYHAYRKCEIGMGLVVKECHAFEEI